MVIIMDSSRTSDVDNEARSDMKDAVSYLLRGGSLLSAPCAKCSGVQIKYKDEIICINCGKQESVDEITAKPTSEHQVSNAGDQFHDDPSFSSHTFEEKIGERIAEQFKILKSEPNDINNEKQRIELIGMYLDLLDRLRNYPRKIQK
jgi:uncharacterized Zn finger protein (UPF0148 family)